MASLTRCTSPTRGRTRAAPRERRHRDVQRSVDRVDEPLHEPAVNDELATYDAIDDDQSALDVLGQDVLATIARELVTMMRDATVDWTIRDDVRAKLRSNIKRLRK